MSLTLAQPLLHKLSPTLCRIAREKPVFFVLGVAGTLSGIWWVVRDYYRWKALGPGGAPSNPLGWLRVSLLTTLATRQSGIADTAELDKLVQQITDEEGEGGVFRRLSLEQRKGRRPEVRGVIPQRQVDDLGSRALSEELDAYIFKLASDYPTILCTAPSAWEGGHVDALFLRRAPVANSSSLSARTLANVAPRLEIAHMHITDGALHVPLSPADAAEVISKGWGVRHRLAGKVIVPSTYLLLYAPRDADEVAVVKKIIAATVEYTTGLSNVA